MTIDILNVYSSVYFRRLTVVKFVAIMLSR